MSSKYYCTKCQHNHYYSSKIGKKHLEYKKNNVGPNNEPEVIRVQKNEIRGQVIISKVLSGEELDEGTRTDVESSNPVVRFIEEYQKSYQKGIEMYGVWWKIFHLSIWSIILVFILTASIVFIIFLPKIDFINWILR